MEKTERRGSASVTRAVEPGVVSFQLLDTFSVFDIGPHHQTIPGKGKAVCTYAVKSFEIARSFGLATHFIEQVTDDTFHAWEFKIPGEASLSGGVKGEALSLELIRRIRLFGSLERKVRDALTAAGIEPDTVISTGMKLPKPLFHATTKREDIDRELTSDEALQIAGLKKSDWKGLEEFVTVADNLCEPQFTEAGFQHPDGKKEVGLTSRGELVMIDRFCTPDEDRIVEQQPDGSFLHYDKELLRQKFIDIGFYAAVKAARTKGEVIPPYPDLSEEFIVLVASRYSSGSERYENARPRY